MIFFDNRTDFEIGGNILALLESIAHSVTNRDIEFLLVSDDEICKEWEQIKEFLQ